MSTQNTQVSVVPANFELPAYLRTEGAAAAIAAYNAAAAGGIKTGGFPRISIKGGKFHIVEGDTTTTIMTPPAAPGAPATPSQLLRVVIVAPNPALSKLYYAGDWTEGDNHEPDCSSVNGITPDAHIVNKQSPACANCPQNQWGSKISKASGKEVKACSDVKQLALLPADDLSYKALGLQVTPAALSDWDKYVKALSRRGCPVNAIVTNVMFDATASFPKLQFSFGGVLTAEQYAQVVERGKGDDVQNIVAPVRIPAVPQLPAPADPLARLDAATKAAIAAVGGPDSVAGKAILAALQTVATQEQTAEATGGNPGLPDDRGPVSAAAPAPTTGFGGAPAQPEAKRKRAPRKPPEVAQDTAKLAAEQAAQVSKIAKDVAAAVQQSTAVDPLAHLPPEVKATVNMLGADTELAKALIAKYPAPTVAAPVHVSGFGAPPPQVATSTAASAVVNSLRDKLAARLKQGQANAAAAR